jgi:hypothetical protein
MDRVAMCVGTKERDLALKVTRRQGSTGRPSTISLKNDTANLIQLVLSAAAYATVAEIATTPTRARRNANLFSGFDGYFFDCDSLSCLHQDTDGGSKPGEVF